MSPLINRRAFLVSAMSASLAAPALASQTQDLSRREVRLKQTEPAGRIYVFADQHFLVATLGEDRAMWYAIAVGAPGRNLSGSARIGRKEEFPAWVPTANMIRREPAIYGKLAGGLPGGHPRNPLGARALYLYRGNRDTMYRIHGTPDPWSIGQSVSSGCVRMVNEDIIDLYDRISVGAPVAFR